MKVAIIGCGPAGLAAAHAAYGLDCEVTVYAPKKKSPQIGPLLIQRPIPGINTWHPDGTIHQIVIGGSILDYRYKLYGDVNISINGDILRPEYHAWNHRETYDRLWHEYESLIEDRYVSGDELANMHGAFDLVVSTANAEKLCMYSGHVPDECEFRSASVWVTPMASYPDQPPDTIIFNAGSKYPWVRSSRIFGVDVTEWDGNHIRDAVMNPNYPPESVRLIHKPISTDCSCFPHVLRTGRFGAWRNETWVDTAYWDTYTAIISMRRGKELDSIK